MQGKVAIGNCDVIDPSLPSTIDFAALHGSFLA